MGAGEVLKDAVPKGDFTQSAYYQDTLSRSDISQQAVPAPESSERGHRTPDTLQQPVDSLSLSCICVLSPATPDPSRQSDKNWALGAPGYEKPGVVGASLEVWKYADVVGIPKLGIPSLKTQWAWPVTTLFHGSYSLLPVHQALDHPRNVYIFQDILLVPPSPSSVTSR